MSKRHWYFTARGTISDLDTGKDIAHVGDPKGLIAEEDRKNAEIITTAVNQHVELVNAKTEFEKLRENIRQILPTLESTQQRLLQQRLDDLDTQFPRLNSVTPAG